VADARADVDEATRRSDDRKRMAEDRAENAKRRAVVARQEADTARDRGNSRAAAVHDHEVAVHLRAVDVHLQAVRLQEAHTRELVEVSGRTGIDERGLQQLMRNVRLARDEAQLRRVRARTFARRARERAQELHTRREPGPNA
jgi:hypothetical protein